VRLVNRWAAVAGAAAVGYLAGSVSFSRLIGRWRAPGTDLSRSEMVIDEQGTTVTLVGTTPTSVMHHVGGGWAGAAVALEAAKAAVPAYAASRLAPGTGAAHAAAAAAVLGHALPLWQGGRDGGYGASPMLGGMLVLDPVGLLATNGLVMAAIGVTRERRIVMLWPLTLPLWAVVRRDPRLLAYATAANAVMWTRLAPQLRSSLSGFVRQG
jgi:glycerol-3-phosphate acyltransferase PlsY